MAPETAVLPGDVFPQGTGSADSPGLADSVWTPVVAVFDEAPDVKTFRIARPRGFEFQAGQSLTVDVPCGEKVLSLPFPISSAPESVGYLEITVKKRGTASASMHDTVEAGSLLSIRPPEGSFVYPAGDRRPVVLVGGGAACAPLMSMLRHAVVRDPSRPVTFLLSAQTAQDVPFRRELHVLARHPRVRVGVSLTREEGRRGYVSGRIDEALLRRAAPEPADTLFFLAGPRPMVEGMKHLLARMGVPPAQVRCTDSGTRADRAPEASILSRSASEEEAPFRTDEEIGDESAVRRFRHGLHEEEIDQRLEAIIEPSPRHFAALLHFPQTIRDVLRFRRGERMLHWAIAVPFVVCFATGMVLKLFYALNPDGISRDVLSFVHKVAGGSFAVFPTLAVLYNWRDLDIHFYNVKIGWTWTLDDVKWLFLMGPATFSSRFTLPDQRKFNAAERLNFMAVMVTYPLFAATGIVLWTPGIHFLPWVAHVGAAAMVVPLVLGHVYMALVNPETRVGLSGMLHGHVDREWARHHYTTWYRDHFEDNGTPRK